MPLFVITGHDVANSHLLRQSCRSSHLERLNQLQNQGRLVIAGPTPISHTIDSDLMQMTGSLIIAEFDSLQSAQSWVNSEPYLKAGVYSHVDIKPFLQVLPPIN